MKPHPRAVQLIAAVVEEQLKSLAQRRFSRVREQCRAVRDYSHRFEGLSLQLAIASERGWHAATQQVLRQLRDTACELVDDATPLTKSADPLNQSLPPTDRQITGELEQIQSEFGRWTFEPKTKLLAIETEPIELEGVYLGPFEVALNLGELSLLGTRHIYEVVATDPHRPTGNDSVTHPHVSDDRLCEGDASVPIRSALESGRLIEAFLASPLAKDEGVILAVEETVTSEIADDLPDVLARVDLMRTDDAGLHVVDFKTARSKWTLDKAIESAEQLMLYQHMVAMMAESDTQPIHLHFGIITKAKSPSVQVMDIPADPARARRVVDSIRIVWQAIEAGNFYPSPGPINCATCAFKSRCPAFT